MEVNTTKQNRRTPRILFLNRSYWPDGEATGQLLTELTEDLAEQFDVTVIAGLPNSNPSQERFRICRTELRKGVRILRTPHTRFSKRSIPGRLINFVTFLFAALIHGLLCRRQDVVIVETDPFLLSYVGWILRVRHRAALVVYLQDIHPDLGIAIGRLRDSMVTRLLRQSLATCYRSADRVVVLSEDMCDTVKAWGVASSKLIRIPNWIDTELVMPSVRQPHVRSQIPQHAFVVMYSGNLGATQQLDRFIDAAELLRHRDDIHFVIVGNGSAETALRSQVSEKRLTNVTFTPFQPKAMLGASLSSADLHLVTVHPSALAFLMPSKLYGILAVGRPIIAAVPENSELARVIQENRIGFVVAPGDATAMARTIEEAVCRKDELRAAGERARSLAVSDYDRRNVTGQFADMLTEVLHKVSPCVRSISTSTSR